MISESGSSDCVPRTHRTSNLLLLGLGLLGAGGVGFGLGLRLGFQPRPLLVGELEAITADDRHLQGEDRADTRRVIGPLVVLQGDDLDPRVVGDLTGRLEREVPDPEVPEAAEAIEDSADLGLHEGVLVEQTDLDTVQTDHPADADLVDRLRVDTERARVAQRVTGQDRAVATERGTGVAVIDAEVRYQTRADEPGVEDDTPTDAEGGPERAVVRVLELGGTDVGGVRGLADGVHDLEGSLDLLDPQGVLGLEPIDLPLGRRETTVGLHELALLGLAVEALAEQDRRGEGRVRGGGAVHTVSAHHGPDPFGSVDGVPVRDALRGGVGEPHRLAEIDPLHLREDLGVLVHGGRDLLHLAGGPVGGALRVHRIDDVPVARVGVDRHLTLEDVGVEVEDEAVLLAHRPSGLVAPHQARDGTEVPSADDGALEVGLPPVADGAVDAVGQLDGGPQAHRLVGLGVAVRLRALVLLRLGLLLVRGDRGRRGRGRRGGGGGRGGLRAGVGARKRGSGNENQGDQHVRLRCGILAALSTLGTGKLTQNCAPVRCVLLGIEPFGRTEVGVGR